jgi:Glu-tRNA(Gln) amidotransferase subunit E-like FAD-binding protein
VTYQWNKDAPGFVQGSNTSKLGFLAQDVYEALPNKELREGLVRIDQKGYYGLLYAEMVALLTGAVQEHEAKISSLTGAVHEHEATISSLTGAVQEHEPTVSSLTGAVLEHEATISSLTEAMKQQEAANEDLKASIKNLSDRHEDDIRKLKESILRLIKGSVLKVSNSK